MVGNLMSGMDPRLVKMALKKMGIKQEDIISSKVTIETADKNIVINNPTVTKVEMQGQASFQISGEVSEESSSSEDIEMIMEQTGASEEKVKKSLDKNKGDIAKTILDLKK